jgi:hypothetical protein
MHEDQEHHVWFPATPSHPMRRWEVIVIYALVGFGAGTLIMIVLQH